MAKTVNQMAAKDPFVYAKPAARSGMAVQPDAMVQQLFKERKSSRSKS